MSKDLFKQHIDFMEYPLWMQDQEEAHNADEKLVWKNLDGYIYESGYKAPVKTDIIFLYAILLRCQNNGWEEVIELSRYDLLKDCELQKSRNTYWYQRIEESFKRWKHVVVTFERFHEKGTRTKMQFGIVDHWEICEKNKKIKIRLSPEWIESIKHSKYFKMIDFNQMKSLRSPLATRLYELLIKTFEGRSNWSCGAKKLAAKIPMKEKYAAHIIPKIKAAINRINEKTELQIKLTIRRPKRGKAIFDFEKLENQPKSSTETQGSPTTKPHIVDVPPEQAESFKELLDLLPSKEQGKKTLRELITRKLRKEGPDFVRRNIIYANKNANTNYRVYLTKAFKEDWGQAYEEDQQQERAARQARQAAEEEQRRKQREEERLEEQAREALQTMTPEEKQALEDQARAKLELTNPTMLQGSFASVALKIQMNALLIEHFKAAETSS